MVKVRQGKPVKKEANGCREGGRWRPCEAGAPLRRYRRIRPSSVDRPNWKAECAETCLLRLERGKGCKALPIATLLFPSSRPAGGDDGPIRCRERLGGLLKYYEQKAAW